MLFWLEFHQNTIKIPSKYHSNSRKYHKNSIRIPVLSAKKWLVFHQNNSGKHAVNLDKIDGSIPMVFQWYSVKIPLWFQMFTSGMPVEFLWNTALKFQHFFRGYIFHTIYPTRQYWQMILSQINIFNFFPRSVQASSIIRILSSFFNRYGHDYIPHRDVWINRLYFEISNSTQKQWLTIDTRNVNGLGPAKFRTQTDNNKEQFCYHNRNKRDTSFT